MGSDRPGFLIALDAATSRLLLLASSLVGIMKLPSWAGFWGVLRGSCGPAPDRARSPCGGITKSATLLVTWRSTMIWNPKTSDRRLSWSKYHADATCVSSMCGWAVWQRNKGFMSLDLYRHVLREMRANGIDNLNLTNPQGEPLLSPHAAECIRLGIEGGFNINLNTNCTTLGERNIGVICEAAKSGRLHTQASFSGFDQGTHELVYQGSRF